jgi:hypothetical protein
MPTEEAETQPEKRPKTAVAAAPSPPPPPPPLPVLRVWLTIIALFLATSAVALFLRPEEQVDRLLTHSREVVGTSQRCPWTCARGKRWRFGWCPERCNSGNSSTSFITGLAPHLVRALGTTYAALALLALALAFASPLVRVAGAQCFTVWSLLQLASASDSLLSEEDASRRLAFHWMLIIVNSICSGWSLQYERV